MLNRLYTSRLLCVSFTFEAMLYNPFFRAKITKMSSFANRAWWSKWTGYIYYRYSPCSTNIICPILLHWPNTSTPWLSQTQPTHTTLRKRSCSDDVRAHRWNTNITWSKMRFESVDTFFNSLMQWSTVHKERKLLLSVAFECWLSIFSFCQNGSLRVVTVRPHAAGLSTNTDRSVCFLPAPQLLGITSFYFKMRFIVFRLY